MGWRLHYLQADLAACGGFFQSIRMPDEAKVVLLSPLLWTFEGVHSAVEALSPGAESGPIEVTRAIYTNSYRFHIVFME